MKFPINLSFLAKATLCPVVLRKMLFVVGRAEGCYGYSVFTATIISFKLYGKRYINGQQEN